MRIFFITNSRIKMNHNNIYVYIENRKNIKIYTFVRLQTIKLRLFRLLFFIYIILSAFVLNLARKLTKSTLQPAEDMVMAC